MADTVLGIDLGTTNSVVAVADGGQVRVLSDEVGHRLIPSVVSFRADGKILVGDEARDRRLLDAQNTVYSVKRLIGRPFKSEEVQRAKDRFAFNLVENTNGGVVVDVRGETYTLTEISAFVLREVRRVAERIIGHSVTRAVITVPANFNELQRSATKAAGRVAGLTVARIINEPTAAALAYGFGKTKPERVAVYDLGGGTFDLTLLELENDVFEVVGTAGDSFLGGDDLDMVIAEMMAEEMISNEKWDPREEHQVFERIRAAAEWTKCQLSAQDEVEVVLEELERGNGKTSNLKLNISREAFEERARELLKNSLDVCDDALGEAGLSVDDMDSVIMVGGSTRVPLVRQMVKEHFGKDPRVEIDPDLVVAQGAAIHAYALSGNRGTNRSPKRALGRVALKKMTLAELKAAKEKRAKRMQALPKGPAFAPTEQIEEIPAPPEKPGRPTAPPLEQVPELPAPSSRSAPRPARVDEFSATPGRSLPPVVDDESMPPARPSVPGLVDMLDNDMEFVDDDEEFRLSEDLFGDAGTSELADIAASIAAKGALEARLPPPPPPAAMRPVVEMPDAAMPLLMDVTPLSLGIETLGGYCQHLIKKNAPIPAESTRRFTTGQDNQDSVRISICQGESKTFEENQLLGEIELSGLRAAARGEVKIEVVFIIDASGTLNVEAIDADTGQKHAIKVNLLGGVQEDEIEAMIARQQRALGEG